MANLTSYGARLVSTAAGVAVLTVLGRAIIPENPTTVGFGYLLLVLIIASTWGFLEAAVGSVLSTLTFNFFFLPPVGTFTIADPQNWVALFSFLVTALIASRLSTLAKQRASEAMSRQLDLERLYAFSRAILLIDGEPFGKLLAQRLAETFEFRAVVLYERKPDVVHKAGPEEFDGLIDQLKESALTGTYFTSADRNQTVVAVRLGTEPIASLAMQGRPMTDSLSQAIANLVAIGLERAQAQALTHQIEAVHRTEELRTAMVDAMAHELKTPLTSIKAATTALLANPANPDSRIELVKVADEEADRLKSLLETSLEMARLDSQELQPHREPHELERVLEEAVTAITPRLDGRQIDRMGQREIWADFDSRLIKIAVQQLLDNASKYSPPGEPIRVSTIVDRDSAVIEITDRGPGIPSAEQTKIFDRFYRSPSVQRLIPGSGLGLSIAQRIAQAHDGSLTVESHPGETTFRLKLPLHGREETK